MLKLFDSLFDLMDAFPDEQSCIDRLRSIRWRNGESCPYCGCGRIMHFSDKKTFKCGDCRERFSIKVGTIFQDTKLPLRKWFMAIWLITNHSKGVASTTLAKDLKITQKSAWFMLHRLRHAARTQSFAAPLSGEVEADTTFVGGKEKNKHASRKTPGSQGGVNKAVVLGIIERDSELRTAHVADTRAKTLQDEVRKNVKAKSAVLTGEDRAFVGLVWALLKRPIYGIHHRVSEKHLKRYVAEMTYRFNARELTVTDRMNGLFAQIEGPIPSRVLIA